MTDSKRFLIAAAMVAAPLTAVSAAAQARPDRDGAVARLEQAAGGRLEVSRAPGEGPVRFLSVTGGPGIAVAGASAEERARTFLGAYGDAFGLEAGEELLLVQRPETDEVGMEHVRMQQTHQGVPITGAELIVHLRGGRVLGANGKSLPDLGNVDMTPRIGPDRALEVARGLVLRKYGEGEVTLSTPRLELLDVPLLGGPPRPRGLAWFVETSRLDMREFVWVEARRGFPMLHFSQLPLRDIIDPHVLHGGASLPTETHSRRTLELYIGGDS